MGTREYETVYEDESVRSGQLIIGPDAELF